MQVTMSITALHALDIGLNLLYAGGVGFVFWVLYKDGAGFRFRIVGLVLCSAMLAILPLVLLGAALLASDRGIPAFVKWLTHTEAFIVAISVTILIIKPELMGYVRRPKRN